MNQTLKDRTDILFLILDVVLTIENSTVFQAQVVDQVVALRKLGYTVAVLCASKDRAKFEFAAGNKLEEYQVPVHLVSDLGLFKNIFSFAAALKSLEQSQKNWANLYSRILGGISNPSRLAHGSIKLCLRCSRRYH